MQYIYPTVLNGLSYFRVLHCTALFSYSTKCSRPDHWFPIDHKDTTPVYPDRIDSVIIASLIAPATRQQAGVPILSAWVRKNNLWLVRHGRIGQSRVRSEEHTSELQSRENLVCRLLLEKKKNK